MNIAAILSNKMNYLSNKDLNKITNHLKRNKLPIFDNEIYNKKIFEIIKTDKKNINNKINFIYINRIGNGFLSNKLSLEDMKKKLIKN